MKNTREDARYYTIKDVLDSLFRYDEEKKMFYAWHHEGTFAIHSLVSSFNFTIDELNKFAIRNLIERKLIKEEDKDKVKFIF